MMKLSQTLTTTALLAGLLAIAGCHPASAVMDYPRDYSLDEIEIISEGVVESGICITYRVPPETLYHSPGASVVRKGNQVHLAFRRALVDGNPGEIDLRSVLNDDFSYSVTIPNANTRDHPVEVILNGQESLGPWSFEPQISDTLLEPKPTMNQSGPVSVFDSSQPHP